MFTLLNRLWIVGCLLVLFAGVVGLVVTGDPVPYGFLFAAGIFGAFALALVSPLITLARWSMLPIETLRPHARGYFEEIELLHTFPPPPQVKVRRLERGQGARADMLTFWSESNNTGNSRGSTFHLDMVVRVAADCPVAMQIVPAKGLMRTLYGMAGMTTVESGISEVDDNYMILSREPVIAGAFWTPEGAEVIERTFAAVREAATGATQVQILFFPTGVAAYLVTVSADMASQDRVDAVISALRPLVELAEGR